MLRSLAGVSAQRVVLVGLGKQAEYNARAHASAEQAFAAACVAAQVGEGVSTLAGVAIEGVPVRARARSAATPRARRPTITMRRSARPIATPAPG